MRDAVVCESRRIISSSTARAFPQPHRSTAAPHPAASHVTCHFPAEMVAAVADDSMAAKSSSSPLLGLYYDGPCIPSCELHDVLGDGLNDLGGSTKLAW
jgi:hypothetical protein